MKVYNLIQCLARMPGSLEVRLGVSGKRNSRIKSDLRVVSVHRWDIEDERGPIRDSEQNTNYGEDWAMIILDRERK